MTHRFPKNFWLQLSPGKQAKAGTAKKETRHRLTVEKAEMPEVAATQETREQILRSDSHIRSVFVPRHYEEKYAYPLILWLHGAGGSERDLADVMPQISTRNYVGVGFRGTTPAGASAPLGFRWSPTEEVLERFSAELYEQVCTIRRTLHVHSERIYLAGVGEGATFGLALLLKRPEWFAGAIAIGGHFPQKNAPLAKFRHLNGKRVLLASETGPNREISNYDSAARLLFSAGIDTSVVDFDPAQQMSKMLRRIDHFVMQGIHNEQ
ncbi:MAG: alpha/beta hydrolase [Planctomycetaceae bacterium]